MKNIGTNSRQTAGVPSIPAFSLYGEAPRPEVRTIHVETLAARSERHAWTIRAHRHRDLYQLLLMQSGSVTVSLDERVLETEAPCVVVVPPGCVHSYVFRRPALGQVVSFSAELAQQISIEDPTNALQRPGIYGPEFPAPRIRDVQHFGRLLLEEFVQSAVGKELALYGLLSVLIANLLRMLAAQTPYPPSIIPLREREIVARFRERVEVGFREHRSVAAYARDLGISEAALRRACLAVAGQSPTNILYYRLAVEAARQLRYTATPVAQIGQQLGFQDPAYFTRFFKREMRFSPTTYRRRASAPDST